MAEDVTVDLDSFSISSYLDKNFVLTVSTSMLISVPGHDPHNPTAAELRDRVQAGSLWITRAGSCRIDLSIAFRGSLEGGLRERLQHMIIEAFEDFPVWDALGLGLRREYNRFHELQGSRSIYPYSVQHNQQNSGLVAPDQVPCAYMSVLTCYLTFGSKSTLVSVLQSNTTVEPQKSKIVNLSASPRRLQRLIATKQHQGGSAEPPIPLTRKSKMVRLKVPPGELRRIFGVPDIYSLAVELQAKRLEHLTHTALLSVFGSRKRFPGIRFLEKPGSLTAIHVAPAVWIPRFFQDVTLRAQLASFISSALGNLMNSESPSLRHKIRSLGLDPPQELHRQTLLLILRSTRVPKLQVQTHRGGLKSQDAADSVVEDARIYDPNESQDTTEPRDTPVATHDGPLRDGTLPHSETMVDARDDSNPNLANVEACAWGTDLMVDDELVLGYELPYSGSICSASQFNPEIFQEPSGTGTDLLPDGEIFQDQTLYGKQGDDDQVHQDSLFLNAMNVEYVEDVGLVHRNFEHEPNIRDSDDFASDMQLYDDDVHIKYYHHAYIGAEREWDYHQVDRQRFHNLDDSENLECDRRGEEYGTKADLMRNFGATGSHLGLKLPLSGHGDNTMDVWSDEDSPDHEMDRNLGELEDGYQYEDMSIHPNDVFTDEDAASMVMRKGDSDETGSIVDGTEVDATEEDDCDGVEVENESAQTGASIIRGEGVSLTSIWPCYRYAVPENGMEGGSPRVRGMPHPPDWAASTFWEDSLSTHAPVHNRIAP